MNFARLFCLVMSALFFFYSSIINACERWQAVYLPKTAKELQLNPDQIARLLAGIPVEGLPLEHLDNLKSFSRQFEEDTVGRYANDYQSTFMVSNKVKSGLEQMRVFREKHLALLKQNQVIYPFGGPDLLFPSMLFSFERLISVGQESTGTEAIPRIFQDVDNSFYVMIDNSYYELNHAIEDICYSLASLLMRTYFVTSSMVSELRGGVLVAYMVQLATLRATISYITGDAQTLEVGYSFMSANEKKAIYLRKDLSEKESIEHIKKLTQENDVLVFLKAASYLLFPGMDAAKFAPFISWINDTPNIKSVVQTVSGLPFQSFGQAKWHFEFFGAYLPVAMHPSFKGTINNMGVDETLVYNFYNALINAEPLSGADLEYKNNLLSNCPFISNKYPRALIKTDRVSDYKWSGSLGFCIGYPCFLSRICADNSGQLWNEKAFPESLDNLSFLMIAHKNI